MVKVKPDELKRAIETLFKESIKGENIIIRIDQTKVYFETADRYENGVSVCLHDIDYSLFPTVSKTERL